MFEQLSFYRDTRRRTGDKYNSFLFLAWFILDWLLEIDKKREGNEMHLLYI